MIPGRRRVVIETQEETYGQMRSDKADMRVRIVHSDGNCTLVACHARQTRLLDRTLDVLDVGEHRRSHKDAKCGTDELTAAEQHVFFAANTLSSSIETRSHRVLPQLLPRRVAVHDLLWAEFHNLLEAHDDNLGLCVPNFLRTQPRGQVFFDAIGAAV